MVTIKDLAIRYINELIANPTEKKAKEIAERIKKLKSNGAPLSKENIKLLLTYIEDPCYNPKTGQKILLESDNSAFLNLVNIIDSNVNKEGK